MTAQYIVDALCESSKGVTPERIEKAKALARRTRVEWAEVLATMTPAQLALLEAA